MGAALTSWADVIGFTANASCTGPVWVGLGRLHPERPTADATAEQVDEYLGQVEDILLGEVRSWGEKWGSADNNDP